jgi:hypothetical protein
MTESLICRCSRATLYDVLQVSPWCEPDVIQAAYRALARTRHPDVNRDPDAEDQMRRLNVAYQVLSDPVRRTRYDEELVLEAGRPVPGRTVTRTADPPRPGAAQPTPSRPAQPMDDFDYWEPPAPSAPRAGARPGPRPSERPRPAPAAASRSAAFPSMGLDEHGGLPRSVLYVSVVMVTVVAALVLWMVIDAFVDRPVPTYRGVRVGEERDLGSAPRSPWLGDGPSQNPGLSGSQDRWNR